MYHLTSNGYTEWKFDKVHIKQKLTRVRKLIAKLEEQGIKFDGIAMIGTSGTWLGPLLVMAGYRVVLVRKAGEQSHGTPVEARHGEYRELALIDDLVASGATVKAARDTIREETGDPDFRFKAILLYDQTHTEDYTINGQTVYGYDY